MFTRFLLVLLFALAGAEASLAQGNGNSAAPSSQGNGSGTASGRGDSLGIGISDGIGAGGTSGGLSKVNGEASSTARGGNNHGLSVKNGDGALQTLTPDQALAVVRTRQALPLSDLAEIVRQRNGGEIVDAELLRVGQMLVYAIKMLDRDDRLSVQYFYARSGRPLGE
ncbi:PepSY domain-containing protein [Devosia ureilytica]|uniref:PepSY domain-containing protein n=1 Tax=Devosia ureilytica TaxID=2952754 RepID=A0A9Q4FT08_9HYPH|nr:hypothetical protein [Devosia ureilytica]MCP8887379.1 hypothetical protein [Devosia ureilytica]